VTPNPPRHVMRWIAGAGWAALLGAYLWAIAATGRTPIDVLGEIVGFLVDHPLGPVLYVMAGAVRPLFVFSSSMLTIGALTLAGALQRTLWGLRRLARPGT